MATILIIDDSDNRDLDSLHRFSESDYPLVLPKSNEPFAAADLSRPERYHGSRWQSSGALGGKSPDLLFAG